MRAARAGASFQGTLEIAYSACLWSRLASRVLLRVTEVPASSPEELYEGVRAVPWEEHVSVDGTIAVDFTSSRSPITHTKYGALKSKDAIVDRFRDRTGRRPNVDVEAPDLRINIAARARSAVVSLDLAGAPLHRRGYRQSGIQVEAPLKETLAAAVLLFADWPRIASEGGAFVDPMCGSGTLAIEAALIAGDRAPGILRDRWGFDGWAQHDVDLWHALLTSADDRAEAGLEALPPIIASDIDPRAVSIARECVRRAGLTGRVAIESGDVREAIAPDGMHDGLIAINPPYGERLGNPDDLRSLYAGLGMTVRRSFPGWRVAMIASDERLVSATALPILGRHEVMNGRIPAAVYLLKGPVVKARVAQQSRDAAGSAADAMFANRVRKNLKRLGQWARRSGVSCYRVYDADMPEYAVAIDLYEGAGPDEGRLWAHVAEYAPPRDVDPLAAQGRLDEVMSVVPEVLGIDSSDVFLKVRRRQKGDAQYERQDVRGTPHLVAEDGLLFEVNLEEYLDTGLFLDHRLTRRMLRQMSPGARVLNLFAYTGAASVYAAAGGAASTLTVDMSSTYLEWAGRNMERNGFTGARHAMIREDVLGWICGRDARVAGPFDLIFCDPPTFSSSKRMDATLDIQRDHVSLLSSVADLLAPGGTIVFSNNFRRFKMDSTALASIGLSAEDITAETIPEDFARNPRIHNTWRIARDS